MGHNIPHIHIPVKNTYSQAAFENPLCSVHTNGMQTLKRLRKAKGWNQTMLAEAAGVEQSTISKIESGWDGVTLRVLNYIAQALEVPTYTLLQDDRSEAEAKLLQVFRNLPEDRRSGWLDMAQAVLAAPQEDDQ